VRAECDEMDARGKAEKVGIFHKVHRRSSRALEPTSMYKVPLTGRGGP
jgi:hypothetical protein